MWPVQDENTSKLMKAFYAEFLQNNRSLGEALRLAQLQMLKAKVPVSDWSAWKLNGAWRAKLR